MRRRLRAAVVLAAGLVAAAVMGGMGGCQSHASVKFGEMEYYSSRDKAEFDGLKIKMQKPDGTLVEAELQKAGGDSTQSNLAMWGAIGSMTQTLQDLIRKLNVPGFVGPSPTSAGASTPPASGGARANEDAAGDNPTDPPPPKKREPAARPVPTPADQPAKKPDPSGP